jgi:hypothetical protein
MFRSDCNIPIFTVEPTISNLCFDAVSQGAITTPKRAYINDCYLNLGIAIMATYIAIAASHSVLVSLYPAVDHPRHI